MTDRRRVRVRAHGSVQGVWFRDSARREAERSSTAGWVRNCPDGSVEAAIEGTPEAVEAMIRWFQSGPPRAEVTRVDVDDEPPEGDEGFEVR